MKAIHFNCARKYGWNGECFACSQPNFLLSISKVFCSDCGLELVKETGPYSWQSYSAMGLPENFPHNLEL
jgi:rRNA maturation endonuclease Nob1